MKRSTLENWRLRARLIVVVAMAVTLWTSRSPADSVATPQAAKEVVNVGVTVGDLDRSVAFFSDVLDFRKAGETEVAGRDWEQLTGVFGMRARVATLKLGDEAIELTEYLTSGGRPIPVDSRSNDRWFQHIAIVTTDMDKAYARLRQHKVKHASTGPQRLPQWNVNAAGIRAFYFHDPDGHVLEIIQFPQGKGDPRWAKATALFAGIDHTAIVVDDTDRSLAFYRDAMGLKVAGGSENHGDEQEHLNNVFGARLRITTLRAEKGPGVELLEYLSPRTGRSYPADSRADDLWHWQTTIRLDELDPASRLLRAAKAPFVSAAVTTIDKRARCLVRDPDGHAVQLVAP